MSEVINSSKLVELLNSLVDTEIRQIRKMLRSTFYTSRIHIRTLFNVLIKEIKKQNPNFVGERIFHQTFEGEVYNYDQLRKAMSDLLLILNECLLINHRRSDAVRSHLTLLEIYQERKLKKAYQSTIKKTNKFIQEYPKRNTDYFKKLLDLKTSQSSDFGIQGKVEIGFLQETSDLEDVLYLSKKLRTACVQLSHQLIHKHQYNYGLLPSLLKEIEDEKYMCIPAIAIYYYCYRFLTDFNESSYFQEYKKVLLENYHLFDAEDISDSYRSAINYCIRKINEGNHSYQNELWGLYKNGLEQKILLVKNRLPSFTFDNALTIGLRLKEYDWAEKFITEASIFLSPATREQSVLFNSGKLAYARKQHEKALQFLQSADFKDIRINIIGKIILLKIYFELESHQALSSHLDSFQQFIRRKGVSEYHKLNVLNIISYVKKIMALPAYEKEGRLSLKQKIETEKVLTEREWLLKKVSR